jgi:hypothetical protein
MKLDLIFTKRFSYRRRCALSSIGGAIVIRRKPTACAWAQLFFMKGNKKRTLAYSAPNSLTPLSNLFKISRLFNIIPNEIEDKRTQHPIPAEFLLKCSTWLLLPSLISRTLTWTCVRVILFDAINAPGRRQIFISEL